ncbi:hypothetical protein [Rhizohabitans arisaemae]|uniref:hypothetical protein n=1 Tax=Rhizohabitans arisaemae TaxID=2720610 RepID=UPI0024B27243|nr:hypothetical protein [Rhizohabitans arisaemae]
MRIQTSPIRPTLILLICLLASSFTGVRTASADGGPGGSDLHIAQTLGDRELTVVVRRVQGVPGPLRVDVVTHTGTPPGRLTLRAIPVGATARVEDLPPAGSTVSQGELVLGATAGYHGATLRVDRPGPWELVVDDGEQAARIPFIVPAPVVSPPEFTAYAGFTAAGALLLGALGAAVWSRRRWTALVLAGGMVAAAAVGSTGALLSSVTPLPPQPGRELDPTMDNVVDPYAWTVPAVEYSRPPVNVRLRHGRTDAGRPVDLDLLLSDGATGRPVDDLLVHDAALIHLVVVSPSGRLWHLHPIRVGAGHYRVRLTPAEKGRHAVTAELARRGGGVQLVRSPTGFDVDAGPPGTGAAPTPPGLGERDVNGTRVTLGATGLAAGTPTTVTARIGDTADLQPWLGMQGHLIVVGPLPDSDPVGDAAERAPVWAHAHSMAVTARGMADLPDETVAAFGPEVSFTFTFPMPGRYRVWVQAERDYTVLTVPALLTVEPEEGGTP